MRLHATLYIVSNLCQPLKHDTFLEIITLNLRHNLKNLSRGINLRRGSNMVGSTLNCTQCFKS